MKIALDLDSTTGDLTDSIVKVINRGYGRNLSLKDIWNWDLVPVLGLAEDEVRDIIRQAIKTNAYPVMENAKEVIDKLHKYGHEITILTNRSSNHLDLTASWLSKNEINYHRLLLLREWDKPNPERFDIMLDDSVAKLLKIYPYVKQAVLFDRPWNTKCHDVMNRFARAFSWRHFLNIVNDLERGLYG